MCHVVKPKNGYYIRNFNTPKQNRLYSKDLYFEGFHPLNTDRVEAENDNVLQTHKHSFLRRWSRPSFRFLCFYFKNQIT